MVLKLIDSLRELANKEEMGLDRRAAADLLVTSIENLKYPNNFGAFYQYALRWFAGGRYGLKHLDGDEVSLKEVCGLLYLNPRKVLLYVFNNVKLPRDVNAEHKRDCPKDLRPVYVPCNYFSMRGETIRQRKTNDRKRKKGQPRSPYLPVNRFAERVTKLLEQRVA